MEEVSGTADVNSDCTSGVQANKGCRPSVGPNPAHKNGGHGKHKTSGCPQILSSFRRGDLLTGGRRVARISPQLVPFHFPLPVLIHCKLVCLVCVPVFKNTLFEQEDIHTSL